MPYAYSKPSSSRALRRDAPQSSAPASPVRAFATLSRHTSAPAGLARRLQHYAPRVAILLLALSILVLGCLQFARPWMIEQLTQRIPTATVRAASGEALRQLDHQWLSPSALPAERQDALRTRFATMAAPAEGAPAYRLLFRSGEKLGARAFTLPGGEVVITDQLIELARDDREILALLSQQLGMLKSQRRIADALRDAMLPTLAGLYVYGDAHASRALADRFLRTPESAEQVSSADAYAVAMLRANQIEAVWLASVLQRMEQNPFPDAGNLPALLETEADLESRIGAILRELA